MFRAEQSDQLNARSTQEEINRAAALGVQARMIRDEANMFSAQRRKFFGFEDVDADLHASRAGVLGGSLRGGTRNGRDRETKKRMRSRSQQTRSSRHSGTFAIQTTMILWNVAVGVALFT